MATTASLIESITRTTGMAPSSLAEIASALREGGHMPPTKRGRGAAPATPMAASNLALALLLPGPAAIREPDPTYGSSRFLAAAHLEMHPVALETYEVREAISSLDLADGEARFGAVLDGIMKTLIDDPARAFLLDENGSLTHLKVSLQDAGPVARITFQPNDVIGNREVSLEFRQSALAWEHKAQEGLMHPSRRPVLSDGVLAIPALKALLTGDHSETADAARAAENAGRFSTTTLTGPVFEALAACFRQPDTS